MCTGCGKASPVLYDGLCTPCAQDAGHGPAKTKKPKKTYLVTVSGWLPHYDPHQEMVSVVVETEDPVAWYLSKPKVPSRGGTLVFKPHALIGFWEMPETWPSATKEEK